MGIIIDPFKKEEHVTSTNCEPCELDYEAMSKALEEAKRMLGNVRITEIEMSQGMWSILYEKCKKEAADKDKSFPVTHNTLPVKIDIYLKPNEFKIKFTVL